MPASYFIKLYLDENVPVLLVNLLKAKGFNAMSARDAGMLNKSDLQHLEYAVNNSSNDRKLHKIKKPINVGSRRLYACVYYATIKVAATTSIGSLAD